MLCCCLSQGRVFGCPSIRHDLPKGPVGRRSVADSQNYGDDPTAKELIAPPEYASLLVDESAMGQQRNFDKMMKLFKSIGYDIPSDVADTVFAEASAKSGCAEGMASIECFRTLLNDYLEACETGYEGQWRESRGLGGFSSRRC